MHTHKNHIQRSTNKQNDRHTEWHYETFISYPVPTAKLFTERRSRTWVSLCCVCVCLFGNDFVGKHINFWWSLLSPSRYLCPSHGRVRRHPKTLTFISSDVPKCLSTFVVVAVCQLINSENSIRHVLRLLSTEQSLAGDFQISHSNRTIGAC